MNDNSESWASTSVAAPESDLSRFALRHPGGETRLVYGVGEEPRRALADWCEGSVVFVVSSAVVRQRQGDALRDAEAKAAKWHWLEVPDGEDAKRLEVADSLWRRMLALGGRRDSRVTSLGGGSVSDLAGFVAGTFLRGIPVAHVPTTLLGQVDAAIGGKAAVNLPEGKNTVGVFHHPELIAADVGFLGSLPAGELRSGLVESIKMAVTLDPALLVEIEDGLDAILGGDPAALLPVVERSARAKVRVVEADPVEGGDRRILNFGHTLGHAIESALGYRGLRHGEAVAYGMLFAAGLAERLGRGSAVRDDLRRVLARLGLPPLPGLDPAELVTLTRGDKKASREGVAWVLPVGPGQVVYERGLSDRELGDAVDAFLADPWSF